MKAPDSSRVPLPEDQFSESEIARFYDEHARRFMGPVYRRFTKKIVALKPPGNRVLDIGTGSGLLVCELSKARPDCHITGIDISEYMLKLARDNAAGKNLSDRTEFRQAPAEALPFPDGCFDLVVSNASLHLWKNPEKVFDEIARVTAPGGYCLIWDNLRISLLNPFLSLIGILMGMNKAQRLLWRKAIHSAYTPGEARAMLKRSSMKDARVKIYQILTELCIEWKKPRC